MEAAGAAVAINPNECVAHFNLGWSQIALNQSLKAANTYAAALDCTAKQSPNNQNWLFNAAIVDPAFIVAVRKKLSLDQREAAEIFGGGVNAFSRYETGKTKPPLALVKLLKVLERHPELLEEVRSA